MTYDQAFAMLPNVGDGGTKAAEWFCSFGNPGCDGYSEIWHGHDGWRYEIARDYAYDHKGWTIEAQGRHR